MKRLSGWARLWLVIVCLTWLSGMWHTISWGGTFVPLALSREEICERYADEYETSGRWTFAAGVPECRAQASHFVSPKARYEEHLRSFYLGYLGGNALVWALCSLALFAAAMAARVVGLWIWRGFKQDAG